MSSFQINGQDPPSAKSTPRQAGYAYHVPVVAGMDGLGCPVVRSADLPWVEFHFTRLPRDGWDWYCSFLDSHRMFGDLTSVRLIDPYTYTNPGGPDWVTYSGDDIVMQAPTYEAISLGSFFGVTVAIRGLG